ncbi:MAG TPA: carboxymuconolactone decarboxylase family protein [Burkholderiales bacterium]|nr:carboxymuconolactone decarboxylase family protein [Burkholderiales bacterium]
MPAAAPKDKVYANAMKARRRILGDKYVDCAQKNVRPHTREFQDMIVRYGWTVWTRPRLDDRTRRILVLGTMVAIGRWEEFDMHLRAALEDGFSVKDVKEVLIQQAIYCGVPAANTAFHHLNALIDELTAQGVKLKDLEK